jgi:hypothetical protein
MDAGAAADVDNSASRGAAEVALPETGPDRQVNPVNLPRSRAKVFKTRRSPLLKMVSRLYRMRPAPAPRGLPI